MAIDGSGIFEPWLGSSGNIGAGSLESWTASAAATETPLPAFEALTAAGFARPTTWRGAAEFLSLAATGELADNAVPLTGAASFEQWTAYGTTPLKGAGELEPLSATGRIRGAWAGAASFEPLSVDARVGRGQLHHLQAAGVASGAVPETYFTGVMNARNKGVTSYDNFSFNSYAKINGRNYGAGPSGLYRLGDADADEGTSISWTIKTGQHDGGVVALKRLPEVVMGLRSSGKVKVKVHPDDLVSYEETLPAVRTSTIRQHRVKPGKGMRSRWYAVELQGVSGSDIELASLQINMVDTTRRIG